MEITEALADCIMRFEGWFPPGSRGISIKGSTSWRNRNPGNLRPYIESQRRDDKGYRIFDNLNDGWYALLLDIEKKLTGKSTHNLTPQSTLHDFFNIYAPFTDNNDPQQYSRVIAGELNLIYNTNLITPDTKLEDLMKLGQ